MKKAFAHLIYKLNIRKILKLASIGLVNTKKEAANILGISIDATKEQILKAYKELALKYHPDKGGTEEQMKLINAAKDFLLEFKNKPEISEELNDFEEDIDPHPTYEEIAEIRKQMGREKFNEKFPGWLNELKNEMGLHEYNKIFEGYDPEYNPIEDERYINSENARSEALDEYIYGIIIDYTDDLEKQWEKEIEMNPKAAKHANFEYIKNLLQLEVLPKEELFNLFNIKLNEAKNKFQANEKEIINSLRHIISRRLSDILGKELKYMKFDSQEAIKLLQLNPNKTYYLTKYLNNNIQEYFNSLEDNRKLHFIQSCINDKKDINIIIDLVKLVPAYARHLRAAIKSNYNEQDSLLFLNTFNLR